MRHRTKLHKNWSKYLNLKNHDFQFLKIHDVGGRHLQNHKNRDISAMV